MFETSGLEESDTPLVCLNDVWDGSVNHGFGVNIIAVVLVDHKYIVVARDTGDKEFSGGVSVYHASGAVEIVIHVMCSRGGIFWRRHVVCDLYISGLLLRVGRGGRKGWMVCQPNVSSHLVQVPLVHGHGLRWVLADSGGSQTGSSCEVSGVYGVTPCGE
jgi:hypothetical protein